MKPLPIFVIAMITAISSVTPVIAEPPPAPNRAELTNLVKRSYPHVAIYNTLCGFALNERNPFSAHGWNKTYKPTALTDHTVTAIAGPNNDTLYVISTLDLRAEPVVISYPAFDSKFVSLETSALDHYCDIPLSTSKGDFKKPVTVLFYSKNTKGYSGQPVPGVDMIRKLSGDFGSAFVRVMPHSNEPERMKANLAAIKNVSVQTLSEFLGKPALTVTLLQFPAYGGDKKTFTSNFLEVLQFAVNHTTFDPADELDRDALATFKKVGVEPGKTYHAEGIAKLDAAVTGEVVDEVIKEAKASRNDYLFDSFLPKGQMKFEAMVCQSVTGPVGQPASEAVYIQLESDNGEPINAQYDYMIRMTADQLPPAKAFWSLTLYDAEKFLFIPNERKKYSVGENAGMKLDDKGGIEIHIAAERPAGVPAENWLPIQRKNLPLNPRLRVYAPDLAKLKAWTSPEVQRVN